MTTPLQPRTLSSAPRTFAWINKGEEYDDSFGLRQPNRYNENRLSTFALSRYSYLPSEFGLALEVFEA